MRAPILLNLILLSVSVSWLRLKDEQEAPDEYCEEGNSESTLVSRTVTVMVS